MMETDISKEHTTILRNNKEHERSVNLTETGRLIGEGARAKIMEVLINNEPMARKEFTDAHDAERAMSGHRILENNLPKTEISHLVPMELDTQANAVVMPKLNNDAWVISMGRNTSADRAELSGKKLPSIPNFNSIAAQLMDAVQACGDRGLEIGPDVYFLTVDHKTHELGYTYADTESMTTERSTLISDDEIPLRNIYWAAGALQLFLNECVENPDAHLVRVLQEALHRMNGYGNPNTYWQKELQEGKEFHWPASDWKQKLSWAKELLKRHAVGLWNN